MPAPPFMFVFPVNSHSRKLQGVQAAVRGVAWVWGGTTYRRQSPGAALVEGVGVVETARVSRLGVREIRRQSRNSPTETRYVFSPFTCILKDTPQGYRQARQNSARYCAFGGVAPSFLPFVLFPLSGSLCVAAATVFHRISGLTHEVSHPVPVRSSGQTQAFS